MRVVVTGAARGLGRAYAEECAREGARLVINDIDDTVIREVEEAIREQGGTVTSCIGSIASWEDARRVVATCVSEFGGIDGIVNNAGLHYVADLEEEDPTAARQMIEVNVLGTVYSGLCAIRQMLGQQSGGVVVNVSSGAAAGQALTGTYCASKAAVSALTWAWALELRERGIRVNAVAPAAYTQMVEHTLAVRESPVTWGPELIAPLVVFLLSSRSARLTGQIVRLWGTDLHLMSHHGPMSPSLNRDRWTVEALSEAFDQDLGLNLQPYGLEMEEFVPFT